MNDKGTYRAVLYGPNTIGSGEEVELDYVDGGYQDILVIQAADSDQNTVRTYQRGRETTEPIPYRFVSESDSGEPDIPN